MDKYQRCKIINTKTRLRSKDQKLVANTLGGETRNFFLRGMKLWQEPPDSIPRGVKVCDGWKRTCTRLWKELLDKTEVIICQKRKVLEFSPAVLKDWEGLWFCTPSPIMYVFYVQFVFCLQHQRLATTREQVCSRFSLR